MRVPALRTLNMNNLHDELIVIRELNSLRDRVKELRERSLRPLLGIKSIKYRVSYGEKTGVEIEEKEGAVCNLKDWFRAGNEVESALVIKIQNHPDISAEFNASKSSDATPELKKRLTKLKITDFFPQNKNIPMSLFQLQPPVSVLMAARAMQTLVSRSNTVFSEASMYCYYRIVRELYAGTNDSMVGAARAGSGGKTSAFVTGECLRAIFSFENAMKRTVNFLKNLRQLNTRFEEVKNLTKSLGDAKDDKEHPLNLWANRVIERMWLDFQVSTDSRNGQIAHFYSSNENEVNEGINQPNELLPKDIDKDATDMVLREEIKTYLKSLEVNFLKAVERAQNHLETAEREIREFRNNKENPYEYSNKKPDLKKDLSVKTSEDKWLIQTFHRTESAHLIAHQMIKQAVEENKEVIKTLKRLEKEGADFNKILDELISQSERTAREISRVAKPIKQYIKTVMHREFAAASSPSPSGFDPGELVFAATAYGALTDWKQSEMLDRACQLLVDSLPETGRLLTLRPLHSSMHGYRMFPIGFEMTRCLAQLFQKTNYEITPKIVERMLNIFDDKPIPVSAKDGDGQEMLAWNFENSPRPYTPSIWVTAVAVLALDRMVRMLNTRINNAILRHFDVYRPEKPHSDLTLNDLIYSDFGFSLYDFYKHPKDEKIYKKLYSIPVSLELMRAHVARASIPQNYIEKCQTAYPIFSVIFYGPPGTGKTTLAESTALSAQVPVVNLSPNDLLVQGQEFIEGRARDVFDALSMLTQVVIILDEFEPILERRVHLDEPVSKPPGLSETAALTDKSLPDKALSDIAAHLKEMRHQVDPQFKFLVAGMLPRLLRLHDVAKKQSVAYCLATNHLKKIDDAAKRIGRFDLTIPVYNPCPLSRAGTLLLRLVQIDPEFKLKGERLKRFVKVLVHTSNESASELAGNYFKIKPEGKKYVSKSRYLKYILDGEPSIEFDFSKADKMRDPETDKDKLEVSEFNEWNWLIAFEKKLRPKKGEEINTDLRNLLEPDSFIWTDTP